MIRTQGVCKSYGALEVLRDVNIEIPAGEVTAIVGPNASGKTTLNKMFLGLVRPDAGAIFIDGASIHGQSAYRERIGYMRQSARFPENLCAADVFDMIARLRPVEPLRDEELIETLDLGPVLSTPIRVLSGGMRQRVNAALAFLLRPDLLILDEPTAALDPVSSSILKDKIRAERTKGRTFVLTSHVLSELEGLADRIVFLLDGSVRFSGRLDEILALTNHSRLEPAIAALMRAHGSAKLHDKAAA